MYTQTAHLDEVYNLDSTGKPSIDYTNKEAIILALILDEMVYELSRNYKSDTFAQQYMLEKGLKWFGNCEMTGLRSEMGQLDNRDCLIPRDIKTFIARERKCM